MLRDRVRTAAVLITIVVVLGYLDANHSWPGGDGLWLLPLLLFFGLGTTWDMADMLRRSGRAIDRRVALAGTALVSLSAAVPIVIRVLGQTDPLGVTGWIVIGFFLAVTEALVVEIARYGKVPSGPDGIKDPANSQDRVNAGGAIERTLAAVFASAYVGGAMAMLVALRSLGDGDWGLAALITTIVVTKSCDTGAYFTGKAIGRNKLIPRLSPGKTVEGAVGAVVTGTIVAILSLTYLMPAIAAGSIGPASPVATNLTSPWLGGLLLGPLLAVGGILGDLAESLFKRDCDAKDSGTWLPGLGGVWDVTDSLIATVTPAYFCFALGVGG